MRQSLACQFFRKVGNENVFDQKLGILTKLTKKIWNFENFGNFEKTRHFLARQSLAKDCTFLSLAGYSSCGFGTCCRCVKK